MKTNNEQNTSVILGGSLPCLAHLDNIIRKEKKKMTNQQEVNGIRSQIYSS